MSRFEAVSDQMRKNTGDIVLPLRATKTSAGYDFFAVEDLVIAPQGKLLMWTDVKAEMPEGQVLLLDVRSSAGIKLDLMLANTMGVIDSDYHNNPSNDGNIGICLRNLKPEFKYWGNRQCAVLDLNGRHIDLEVPQVQDLIAVNTVRIAKGDRVAQGIFVNFQVADNCNSEEERTGGIGSTNV